MRRLVTAVVLSALLASGFAFAQPKSGKSGGYEQLNLFGEAFERIRQDAVEPVGEGLRHPSYKKQKAGGTARLESYVLLLKAAFKALNKSCAA